MRRCQTRITFDYLKIKQLADDRMGSGEDVKNKMWNQFFTEVMISSLFVVIKPVLCTRVGNQLTDWRMLEGSTNKARYSLSLLSYFSK